MKAWLKHAENLSAHVKRFRIKTEFAINAQPGQFITLSFPMLKTQDGEEVQRSYSLLEWGVNESGPFVDLCISLNTKGIVTPWLWELEGEVEIEVSEALGSFLLRDYDSKEYDSIDRIVFICTGTGVVPFVSMIRKLLHGHPSKEIWLFSGTRRMEDELFCAQFRDWENQISWFRYIPVFSRESNAENKGYVHAHYPQQVTLNSHVYVCGWNEMCKETRLKLKELGLTRKQYFFELYN